MGLLDIFKGKKKEDVSVSPVLPKDIREAGVLELRDVIAPSALKISPREINLGDKIVRTFFVISYPRFLSDNWFSPIINLDKVFDVSIAIQPIETARALKEFRKRVAEVESQISEREEKGLVRDPVLDTAYRDLESLRDQLQQATEKLFDVGLYVTIYGEDESELNKLESEIRSVLEAKLIYLKPALFQQEQGFRSVLPVAQDELRVYSKLNTSPLSSIFPFISFDLTSDKGILYGINRHNSSLILFDRFALANYNSVTFATSGSGKSYAAKLEILRTLMFDTDVIVIDPEREYEFLTDAMGGRYFNIALTSEHAINPFDLPPPREDETPANVLRSHIVSLVGLFRIMLGGLSPEEDSLIDRAITETYALKDITGESDFSKAEPPLLSDFELVLAGMEGAESLVQRLTKYTKGTWAGFINRPTNVDINRKFVVFSVRDMEDELKTVAMYIVAHHIWSVIRRDLKKRLLVIDEAWWMMKDDDTASFLFGLVKRGRKYFLGVAAITQDVGDFLRSQYGLPIITNSAVQLLLKQSPSSIDVVQKTFNLTDEEKYLLLESEVGEGIFFAGLKHVAIKIIASYTEDQIITSDPSQLLAIKRSREELGAADKEVAQQAQQIPKVDIAAGDVPKTEAPIRAPEPSTPAPKPSENVLPKTPEVAVGEGPVSTPSPQSRPVTTPTPAPTPPPVTPPESITPKGVAPSTSTGQEQKSVTQTTEQALTQEMQTDTNDVALEPSAPTPEPQMPPRTPTPPQVPAQTDTETPPRKDGVPNPLATIETQTTKQETPASEDGAKNSGTPQQQ